MKLSTVSRGMRMNETRVTRTNSLVTGCLAVVAMISVAACSPSGGGGGDKGHQGQKPTSSPTPAPYNYSANGPGQLDKGSSRSQQEGADSSKDDEVQFSDGTHDGTEGSSASEKSAAKKKANKKIRKLNAAGVTRTKSTREVAAGDLQDANGTSLLYSGASSDDLRSQIEAIAPSSGNDLAWATELSRGMLYFTQRTREVEVDVLQTRPSGEQYKITLRGRVDREGRALLPDSGSQIYGAIECLDLNGGCETAHVKIVNSAYSPAREAHLIIRTTNSKLRTTGKGFDVSHNHDYDWFLNILVNTATGKSDVGYVQRLVVQTSETMHGVSNLSVAMDILNLNRVEFIDFNGPLVRYSDSDETNTVMNQTSRNRPGTLRLISYELTDVRMVTNNGRGEIKVALTVRGANAGSVADTVTLQLDRIENAIKAPSAL